ncbi:multidrug and toxin extrusion protein 1-like, partial [Oncorhynchus masou masou]|uniref:multidrug and toxin extrusion protein 1-like n=1 Tax=Oncorhynchus masou masou TaxID=90313 RepID=UPI0031846245
LISEVELGAQSVVYQLAVITYMFPLGFSVAASVRVGNALGAGNTEQAKLSGKVASICAFIVSCFVSTFVLVTKDVMAYIFTTDQDIVKRVAEIMILYGFFHLADTFVGVMGGVVRGAGKQKIGALCNLVGYYFIGFPIGVSLMFPNKMGIIGLWIGLFTCVLIQSLFLVVLLCKLDWKKPVKRLWRGQESSSLKGKKSSLDWRREAGRRRSHPATRALGRERRTWRGWVGTGGKAGGS